MLGSGGQNRVAKDGLGPQLWVSAPVGALVLLEFPGPLPAGKVRGWAGEEDLCASASVPRTRALGPCAYAAYSRLPIRSPNRVSCKCAPNQGLRSMLGPNRGPRSARPPPALLRLAGRLTSYWVPAGSDNAARRLVRGRRETSVFRAICCAARTAESPGAGGRLPTRPGFQSTADVGVIHLRRARDPAWLRSLRAGSSDDASAPAARCTPCPRRCAPWSGSGRSAGYASHRCETGA